MTKAKNRANQAKATKSKRTRILWIVSSIVLIGLIAWLVLAYGVSPATPPATNNSTGSSTSPADRVEVAYFHRTQQCYSCRYAEEGTRYTVETYFDGELNSGKLTFQSLDVQVGQNAAIVQKYGAYGSQLFINTVKDGTDHIEQVTDIWFVLGDDEAFVEVVKTKIEKALNGET